VDLTTGNDLERQLLLTEALWKQLRFEQGVQQGTPVRVEVYFVATDAAAAQALAARYVSDGWQAGVEKVDDGAELSIRLLTPEVAFSRQMLLDLAELMVAAGIETGCDFDGFQVAVPPPPAWWKFWRW